MTTPAAHDKSRSRLCVKCGHANDAAAERCAACGAHLHLVCRQCGEVNDRAASRCGACGAALHRSSWRRLWSRLRRNIQPLEALIYALAIVIIILLVIEVARQRADSTPPAPAGDSPDTVQWK
jgi:uncharacterized membrane protein YvbJ